MEHLSHFVKAAQGQQHQDGFRFLVDLRGAQVLGPALQYIWALCRVQAHLEEQTKTCWDAQSENTVQLGLQMLNTISKTTLKVTSVLLTLFTFIQPPVSCQKSHILSKHTTQCNVGCIRLTDAVMLSYLSQPCGSVPLPVGLQVAASIRCLVNQTQQLYSLWQIAKQDKLYRRVRKDGLSVPKVVDCLRAARWLLYKMLALVPVSLCKNERPVEFFKLCVGNNAALPFQQKNLTINYLKTFLMLQKIYSVLIKIKSHYLLAFH